MQQLPTPPISRESRVQLTQQEEEKLGRKELNVHEFHILAGGGAYHLSPHLAPAGPRPSLRRWRSAWPGPSGLRAALLPCSQDSSLPTLISSVHHSRHLVMPEHQSRCDFQRGSLELGLGPAGEGPTSRGLVQEQPALPVSALNLRPPWLAAKEADRGNGRCGAGCPLGLPVMVIVLIRARPAGQWLGWAWSCCPLLAVPLTPPRKGSSGQEPSPHPPPGKSLFGLSAREGVQPEPVGAGQDKSRSPSRGSF